MVPDPNFPDRDKYFPNNKDEDGVIWIRTYRVYTGDSGTFGSQCAVQDEAGEWKERIDEKQLAWKDNHDEEKMNKLRELVDDIVEDWQSVIQDIKFIRAPDDEPAHINFIRRDGSYVGTIGWNSCTQWFIQQQDGFPGVHDPELEDNIPRSCWNPTLNKFEKPCRYAYIQNVLAGRSIVGGFGPATMGILSHEFGHVMRLGHVGDVMYFANTTGGTILTGKNSINTALDIHGGKDPNLEGLFPGNETLEEYKDRRLAVREKHYDATKIAQQEEKDIFDFRVWPEEETSKRKKWSWSVNEREPKIIGKGRLGNKLLKWSEKPGKLKSLDIKRIQ